MSTETAPYAFVPGAAKKRSATSRWTITHQSSTFGRPPRLSTTSGVAMLYGRFATSLGGGGVGGRRRAERAEVELRRVAEVELNVGLPRQTLCERGLERAVELDRVNVRHALRQGRGEDAEPGAGPGHD